MKKILILISLLLITACQSESKDDGISKTVSAIQYNVPNTVYDSTINVQMTNLPSEGGTVYLYTDDSCSESVMGNYEVDFVDYGGYASIFFKFLEAGSFTFSVKVVTSIGAVSPCSSFTYNLLDPPQPTAISIVGDSTFYTNSFSTDFTLEEGLYLNAYSDSSCTNQVASSNSSGSLYDVPLGTNIVYFRTINTSDMVSECSTSSITYNRKTLFTSTINLSSYSSSAIDYGDFNNDGNLDITTTTYSTTEILLGDGSGGFSSHTTMSNGFSTDSAITVANFNHSEDSFDDIVTAKGNSIRFFQSNGDGTFASAIVSTIPSGPTTNSHYINRIISTDFDNDGNKDLIAVAGYGSTGSIMIMTGNGDGSFNSPTFVEESDRIDHLLVDDINGDGLVDIIVPIEDDNKVGVYINDASGSLESAVYYTTTISPSAITAIDYDLDNDQDLAIIGDGNYVQILKNDGSINATFQIDINVNFFSNLASVDIKAADIDNDGNDDLLVLHNGNTMSTINGNGDGTFNNAIKHATNYYADDVQVMDLNSDGKDDFIVTAKESGEFGEMYISIQQ